jgi:DNA-binding NtrC family response regulator
MPKHLLIVDDEPALARGMRRQVLWAFPRTLVEVFHDVEQALSRAKEARFDVALLDVQIGKGSGVALALALRAVAPQLPLAFVTGQPKVAEALGASALAPLAILVKPFPASALRAVLEGVLGAAP